MGRFEVISRVTLGFIFLHVITLSICATIEPGISEPAEVARNTKDYYYCCNNYSEDLAVWVIVVIIVAVLIFVTGVIIAIAFCCACCCFAGRRSAKGGAVHTHVHTGPQPQGQGGVIYGHQGQGPAYVNAVYGNEAYAKAGQYPVGPQLQTQQTLRY